MLTAAGRKIVYLQITAPNGNVLQGSSNFVTDTESGNTAYSQRKEVDYQNQALDLTIYYELKGEEAAKGTYKVRIFCEGHLIGTDSFTLK